MSNRARIAAVAFSLVSLAAITLWVMPAARLHARSAGFVVHEWGTFTSVAGPDGQAVNWYPLSEGSDLPCFVRMLTQTSPKVLVSGLPAVRASVRMETPVIYFYAPHEMTAQVSVRFPMGLITEWFPDATVTPTFLPLDAADATGSIDWPRVTVRPGRDVDFLREPGDSHYYPARDTDAAPVSIGDQHEKFLFYRGMAGFPVTVEARVDERGRIVVSNRGTHPLGRVVLFQNIDGRMGYRTTTGLEREAILEPPVLGRDLSDLAAELIGMLVGEGLYMKEARAMVETWRGSWFEDGTRLIYIVPRPDIDRILPLSVSPAPDEVARAFVGRIEIITPAVQDEVERAVVRGDLKTLTRCGRLLQPILASMADRPAIAARQAWIDNALRLVAAANTPENLCPSPEARR